MHWHAAKMRAQLGGLLLVWPNEQLLTAAGAKQVFSVNSMTVQFRCCEYPVFKALELCTRRYRQADFGGMLSYR